MIILIPAFEPDNHLIELIKELQQSCAFQILIVDDGSGADYHTIFEQAQDLGCAVLRYEKNRGKGHALKTGFEYILNNTNESIGVVTADADGQHLVKDILSIAAEVYNQKDKIVLGERKFVGKVPLRSKVGNTATRGIFTLVSGQKILDTQTGLRGFPIKLLPWLLSVEGERFEYEMNMLLEAGKSGYGFVQMYIDTVYTDLNSSSHYRAIKDSVRISFPILKFCASGITAGAVDYFLLFYIQSLTNNLFLSVVTARAASSAVNFIVNKLIVFKSKKAKRKTTLELVKYYTLVCVLLLANYLLLRYFSQTLHIALFWSKVLTELMLFIISYPIQRFFVFKEKVPARMYFY